MVLQTEIGAPPDLTLRKASSLYQSVQVHKLSRPRTIVARRESFIKVEDLFAS